MVVVSLLLGYLQPAAHFSWALLGGDAGGERASSFFCIPSAGLKVKEGVTPLFREGR